jgi:hypothetical protein
LGIPFKKKGAKRARPGVGGEHRRSIWAGEIRDDAGSVFGAGRVCPGMAEGAGRETAVRRFSSCEDVAAILPSGKRRGSPVGMAKRQKTKKGRTEKKRTGLKAGH